ncbi:MAG: hypothetical protein CMN57_06490, partial [Gammaproteobacteria bacterium]|nr:hypothetical protein [Gammaproteobacteria bacterium]
MNSPQLTDGLFAAGQRVDAPAARPRPALAFMAVLTLLLLAAGDLPGTRLFTSLEGYLPVHTTLEFASIAVAAMVFALTWNLRDSATPRLVLLGSGFLCVALIDFGHALSYAGMPALITPNHPEKAIAFWLAARLVAAVTIALVAFLPTRPTWPTRRLAVIGTTLALAISALVFWGIIVHEASLPRTFDPATGLTPLKVNLEYVCVVLFALAAIRLWSRSRQGGDGNLVWLAMAAWTQGLAELFFTLYADVADIHNLLGHVYKALAYWMIYRAVFISGVRDPGDTASALATRLHSIIDATRVGTWEWRADDGSMQINARWAQMFGYPVGALLPMTGARWLDMVHPDDREATRRTVRAHMDGVSAAFRAECRVRHEAGHWVWILAVGSVTTRAEDGSARVMSGVNVDISEIKAHEQRIAEQQRRLNDILTGTNVGTWEWNIPTGAVEFNERWAQMLGYTLDELAPLSIATWQRLAHPDDLARSQQAIEHHFAGRAPYYECEVRLRHKLGHWIWVLDRGKVASRTTQGEPLLMSGTHQDISARKAMEAELQEHRMHLEALVERRTADLADAREASQAKSRFLANMSHEIRTPLNTIIGLCYTLGLSRLDTDQRQQLDTVQSASRHLLALLNDILDVSKIEAGQLALDPRRFDLDALLGEVRKLMAPAASTKGLRFEIDAPAPPVGALIGDDDRLSQMLLNLVNNAIKFTEHGQVRVR